MTSPRTVAAPADEVGSVAAKSDAPIRVVQWTTGHVGRQTALGVIARPDMELVGIYAYSASKVGRDAAELIGLAEPTGIVATNEIAELLALRPDCLVYTPLHFDVDEVVPFLEAGVDVVTTAEFLTGRAFGTEATERLRGAALKGEATIFGSGMNPGFAQLVPAIVSNICSEVRKVTMIESMDVSLFVGDADMDAFGWGEPEGDPAAVEAASVVFRDGVEVLAALLGFAEGVVEPRCRPSFAYATSDLDMPGRKIPAGTVAGVIFHWEGVVGDRVVIDLEQRWLLGMDGSNIDPPLTADQAYLFHIEGDPQVNVRLDIMPRSLENLTMDEIHAIGVRITGLPIVNAIPTVRAAAPGIRTYADLPAFGAAII